MVFVRFEGAAYSVRYVDYLVDPLFGFGAWIIGYIA